MVIKPSPLDILDLYLGSLAALGFDPLVHDIRFVEDNWESPTLGAWGLGWEVWLNGMEVTQFTYFQQVGGLDCRPVTGEITYGLERLAMYLQGVESIFDLVWTDGPLRPRDLWRRVPPERSGAVGLQLRARRHGRAAAALRRPRAGLQRSCSRRSWRCPPTSRCCKASHTFNLLDARRAISVTERQRYILRVRTLARAVAQAYYDSREALGFPMLRRAHGRRRRRRRHERRASERRDFLVELGTEELPPKALRELEAAFARRHRRAAGQRSA